MAEFVARAVKLPLAHEPGDRNQPFPLTTENRGADGWESASAADAATSETDFKDVGDEHLLHFRDVQRADFAAIGVAGIVHEDVDAAHAFSAEASPRRYFLRRS